MGAPYDVGSLQIYGHKQGGDQSVCTDAVRLPTVHNR